MISSTLLNKIDGVRKVADALIKENAPVDNDQPSNNSFSNDHRDHIFKTLKNELNELEDKLIRENLNLVVTGLFKRGKSTLINSIIKKEILPCAIVPLTSVVTELEYGLDAVKVYFNNNTSKTCNFEDISEYATEINNSQNKKNVHHICVQTESSFLKNVTLVDTPGIGSTFENNTETTFNFIPKIDAALFVLSADFPISKEELEFLKELKNRVAKIIFVLNKYDLVDETDKDEILSFNRMVLKEETGSAEIKIFPVSAKMHIVGGNKGDENLISKSGIPALINEITNQLTAEKQNLLLASASSRLFSISEKLAALLQIKITALQTPIDSLNAQFENFRASLRIIRSDKSDFEILIRGKIKQLQEYISASIDEFSKTLCLEMKKQINENKEVLISSIINSGTEAFYEKFFNEIKIEYKQLKNKLEFEIIDRFKSIINEYSKGSNRFLNELVSSFSEHTFFDLQNVTESFNLNIYTSFYFKFDSYYNPFWLSLKLFRKIMSGFIIKRLVENIVKNINQNGARVTYDINYRIQESFIEFNYNLDNNLEESINLFENIITDTMDKKDKTEQTVFKQIEFFSSNLKEIEEIINSKNREKILMYNKP